MHGVLLLFGFVRIRHGLGLHFLVSLFALVVDLLLRLGAALRLLILLCLLLYLILRTLGAFLCTSGFAFRRGLTLGLAAG